VFIIESLVMFKQIISVLFLLSRIDRYHEGECIPVFVVINILVFVFYVGHHCSYVSCIFIFTYMNSQIAAAFHILKFEFQTD